MTEEIELTVTKPLTELQISIDNSVQAIPLTNEAYKAQVNTLDKYYKGELNND